LQLCATVTSLYRWNTEAKQLSGLGDVQVSQVSL